MDIEKIYLLMRKHSIFKNADSAKLAKYITASNVAICEFSSGSEICSPLTKHVPLGMIISGKACVYSANDEKKVLIKTITEGVVFGIATLYGEDSPFPTRISAATSCKVLFISPEAVRALIENDKRVMRAFMTILSKKIVYLNKKINSLTAGSAEKRLSVFLAENAIDNVYTQTTSASAIATMLDIGRASLYRAFDKLEAEGFIERLEKTVIIKDKEAMLKRYSR